ncbi:MAG: hypothetical protein JWQ73_2790 [Variovorax sp.]|nr:hypothetical protein [Variovorax sp.]
MTASSEFTAIDEHAAADDALVVRFFDGRHSRPYAALLKVRGGTLTVAPEDDATPVSVPLAAVRWPERTRHGGRLAQLPDGASLQALDVAAWDDWVGRHHRHESWVVRAQQNWRSVAVALVLLFAAVAAMYQWGLPWVATGVTAAVPRSVDALVGQQVLASLDDSLLKPTTLSPDAQQRIRDGFARMIQHAHPDGAPAVQLEFRSARDPRFGPNALALPGGTIVLTDALVELMPGEDDAVLGVLGHEFGHVLRRHAMRQLVQASAVGFAMSIAFGDYGTLIGSAPVLLATLGYSRDLEREADAESVRLMRASGISPRVMASFFEALERWRADPKADRGGKSGDDAIGLAFSSHPATAERIEFFKNAAQE